MLTTGILISPDANTARRAFDEIRIALGIEMLRVVDHYPSEDEIPRLLELHAPDVIFLQCRTVDLAVGCATLIERIAPGSLVVAVDFEYDSETFLRLMRSGVRELLPFPTNSPKALEAIENISKLVKRSKPQYPNPAPIYCFLPAKPGVGASTLAVNTAMAAAARLNKGALLCDLDTNVGMSAFLLRVSAENSIREAIGCAGRLDEDIWKQVVAPRGDLDVLGPGTLGPAEEFSPAAVEAVIRFASRMYDAIFIDCSGNLEPYCVNLLSSAKQIFLVCTHEVAALHLGRMKAEALKGLDLQDRVTVLLNRSESGHALSIKEVEKLLEFRVRYSFSNDYKRVNQGAMTNGVVDPRSDLGKQFKQFAESLGGAAKTRSGESAPKRRFLEYFAVKPSSFTLHGGQR